MCIRDRSDTATVSVTVSPANDAPVISQGEAVIVTMSEDGDPIAFNLTLSAEDVDGDILEWQIDQDAGHGTATISHTTGVSAAISYTPDTDYYGPDDFDVRVSDGELSDTVTVSVTIEPVNEAPRAIDDYGVLLWGSGENAFTLDVLSNDVEPDGETPYISDVGTPSNGNVTIANLQSLVYTPSITGTDSFTYTISDGSLEDTATVNVAIADGNESGGSGETLLVPNTGGNNSITVTIEIPPDVGSGHEHFALIYGETTDPHDPPQGYAIAGLAFSLNAYVDSVHTAPFTFSTPITLTILYADTDLADIGQGEQALELRYWDGSEWRSDSQGITVVSRDTEQNLLVITIGHLTEFALIGEAGSEIYLPLVVRGMP